MTLLIKNGNVIDPISKKIEILDIFIEKGTIKHLYTPNTQTIFCDNIIDAQGLMIAPGLVDLHVHLRDPGFEYKEDIISGTRAAICGGFTTVACMPNTSPAIDTADTVKYVSNKAKNAGNADVLPIAAVTKGQKGEKLTDFGTLTQAGAAAFSDDGNPVSNAKIMREALIEAKKYGKFVISHCEDAALVDGGVMNEGETAKRLQLKGRPAIAEEIMVARDAMLAHDTGAHVHIAHVSTKGSVDIIRKAKARGVNITCETCPQYFTFTEEEIAVKSALAKVNPPLRTKEDGAAVIEGLIDGTIDIIVTDHAPHSDEEKRLEITKSPSGMIGLETALAAGITALCKPGKLTIPEIIEKMTSAPAKIMGLPERKLAPGAAADIVIFDQDAAWTVNPSAFQSKARNTPFSGIQLNGIIMYTIKGGKILYKHENSNRDHTGG